MPNVDFFGLSGWLIGLLSFAYAIYVQYDGKATFQKFDFQLTSVNKQLEDLELSRINFARTIHEICFNSILHVKNYPNDITGFMLQRESLTATLQSIQRVAQEFVGRMPFSGEYTFGSDLSAIEQSADVNRIWVITRDLRPDIEENSLRETIGKNIVAGKRYTYIVPDYLEADYVRGFYKMLKEEVEICTDGSSDSVEIKKFLDIMTISIKLYYHLFAGGAIAIYQRTNLAGKKINTENLVAFEEVLIPNENRGSMWRRLDPIKGNMLISIISQITGESIHASDQS